MNCSEIISDLGFRCKAINDELIRVWTPFTYGNDGEVVAFYIEKAADNFRVTDNAASLMHAASLGINLTDSRLNKLRRVWGNDISVSGGGEISRIATADTLKEAVAAVINASMIVSHHESGWLPKSKSLSFNEEVGKVLLEAVGEKALKRNVTVPGASGHQIEIPFVIEKEEAHTYIQPVAYGEDRLDWDNVYRGLGKMLDLKNAGASDEARAVVIEDTVSDDEIAKAITLLTISCSVIHFSKLSHWARRFTRI